MSTLETGAQEKDRVNASYKKAPTVLLDIEHSIRVASALFHPVHLSEKYVAQVKETMGM